MKYYRVGGEGKGVHIRAQAGMNFVTIMLFVQQVFHLQCLISVLNFDTWCYYFELNLSLLLLLKKHLTLSCSLAKFEALTITTILCESSNGAEVSDLPQLNFREVWNCNKSTGLEYFRNDNFINKSH